MWLSWDESSFRQFLFCNPIAIPERNKIFIVECLGNYPKESIQHTKHGESLKSRIFIVVYKIYTAQPMKPK